MAPDAVAAGRGRSSRSRSRSRSRSSSSSSSSSSGSSSSSSSSASSSSSSRRSRDGERKRKRKGGDSSSRKRERKEASSSSRKSKKERKGKKELKSKKERKRKKEQKSKKERKGRKRVREEGAAVASSSSSAAAVAVAVAVAASDAGGASGGLGLLEDAAAAQAKRRALEERRGQHVMSLFGYTNADNPFGDSQLTEQFVWGKKAEKERAQGGSSVPKRQFTDRVRELEEVRKRRRDREAEIEQRDAEREAEARERELEMYGNLEEKEDAADREQEKNRCRLRLRNGRAKPLDLIYKNLLLTEDAAALAAEAAGLPARVDLSLRVAGTSFGRPERRAPDAVVRACSAAELAELLSGAEALEARGLDPELWRPVLVLVEAALARQQQQGGAGGAEAQTQARVDALLRDKSDRELAELRAEIEQRRLREGLGDERFWKQALAGIAVLTAASETRARHAELLRGLAASTAAVAPLDEADDEPTQAASVADKAPGADDVVRPGELEMRFVEDHEVGIEPSAGAAADVALPVVDETEDAEQRRRARRAVLEREARRNEELLLSIGDKDPNTVFAAPIASARPGSSSSSSSAGAGAGAGAGAAAGAGAGAAAQAGAGAGAGAAAAAPAPGIDDGDEMYMDEDEFGSEENNLADEVQLPSKVLAWHNKYAPRKPRYSNRVRTGFDWNKYNKTHYDSENPPPKTVQGYKFNIFYPDLIDKSKAPTYSVEPSDSADFAVLRFHAGPPYEDIAFKIVNKEWAAGRRRGFKCVFERGQLQLHFSLKRFFYRR